MSAKPKKKVLDNSAVAAGFVLPDSLPCSEISFPVFKKERPRANWHQILEESNLRKKEIEEYEQSKETSYPISPFQKSACDFIQNEVFGCLLPALESALNKAKLWDALRHPGCFFNGVDWIVQEIWNNNPRHPNRKYDQKHVFNIPWVRKYLVENPRLLYPKSWLWPDKYAATVIQKTVRQYFVQRQVEVQEMRDFWRKLKFEKEFPEVKQNPYLAKELASLSPEVDQHNDEVDVD